MVSDDRTPGRIEPIEHYPHDGVLRSTAVFSNVARQEDKSQRSRKDPIYFIHDRDEIPMILFMGSHHVQIANVDPRNDSSSIGRLRGEVG
jgi:hypothetical protein